VSDPERAVLELLSDVGVRQSLQGARDLLEGASALRAAALQDLLARCEQVKTVRLCLTLGRLMGLPWATKLDPRDSRPATGNDWVATEGRPVVAQGLNPASPGRFVWAEAEPVLGSLVLDGSKCLHNKAVP
jgi:Transcriptional regulator, AbiEi antitoxin, Type IV TA system